MDRIDMLTDVLSQDPNNAFARYGLAMEYSNSGEFDRALEEFNKLLSAHPDYTAGYFMAAQALAKAGRPAEASKMLESGIISAQHRGDGHAESEMRAMLEEINSSL
jgi:predicted Zn-dependent protease